MKNLMIDGLRTMTASLPLGLLIPLVATAAEVNIHSIEHKPNGVTVQWTNSDPGYAYTLQYRALPTSGTWSNVWTRYHWPGVMTQWTEPTARLRNAGFYRVLAEPIQVPERGKLLSTELLRQFTLSDARSRMSSVGFPTIDAAWAVRYYKIVYETVDPFGLPIKASGGLFVPQAVPQAMPLLSNQHGTEIYKRFVPSQNDSYFFPEALFYACAGYVTVMPDYIGLGESPGLFSYVHAKTEATAVVDMLRAVKTFCASNAITLNSQLFLTGYSEGGHATAAAQRELEAYHTNEFSVTASAPRGAPYDVAGTANYILTHTNHPAPFFFIYVLAAWLPIYDLAGTLEELLAPPYNLTLPPLFDGYSFGGDIVSAMGPDAQSALDPDFRDALLNDPDHPFWRAAAENDLLEWTPKAPTRLYHCSGDDIAPYWNATSALQAYTNNGACCVELVNPETTGPLNHDQCQVPSMVAAKAWFDSLKQ